MEINEYINKGFNTMQINQIIKLEDKMNINKIKPNDSVEFLRNLNAIISTKERSKNINGLIYIGLKKGVTDVAKWYDEGITTKKKLSYLIELKSKKYDVNKLIENNYNVQQLELINKYISSNIDVEPYIKAGKDTLKINLIVNGIKAGIDISDLFDTYSNEQIYRIIYAKELGFNLMDFIDNKYTASQLDEIIKGLPDLSDITPVLNPKFSIRTMRTIIDGLKQGINITTEITPDMSYRKVDAIKQLMLAKKDTSIIKTLPYEGKIKTITNAILNDIDPTIMLDNRCSLDRCKIILSFYKKGINMEYSDKVNDLTLTDSQIKTALTLLSYKKNPDPILKPGFDACQVSFLKQAILEDIDVSNFANPDYPPYLMEAYLKCEKFGLKIIDERDDKSERI